MDYDKKLKELCSVFSSERNMEIFQEARTMLSDLSYIQEHFMRTKKSKFNIAITPCLGGVIMDDFFMKLFDSMCYSRSAEQIKKMLSLYYLCYNVMQPVCQWDNMRLAGSIEKMLELSDLVEFYSGERLENNVTSFCGCGSMCQEIYNAITDKKKGSAKT
jgi:hypothetical protein